MPFSFIKTKIIQKKFVENRISFDSTCKGRCQFCKILQGGPVRSKELVGF